MAHQQFRSFGYLVALQSALSSPSDLSCNCVLMCVLTEPVAKPVSGDVCLTHISPNGPKSVLNLAILPSPTARPWPPGPTAYPSVASSCLLRPPARRTA